MKPRTLTRTIWNRPKELHSCCPAHSPLASRAPLVSPIPSRYRVRASKSPAREASRRRSVGGVAAWIVKVLVAARGTGRWRRRRRPVDNMSFVFRGSRADIEAGGFPGFAPERRGMRIHAGGRTVNSNSLGFLVTVLVLIMVLSSNQMSPNFLLWLVLGVFLMATSLRMYATCQQLQAQAQAHAAAANSLLGRTELRVHVPPTIALGARGPLQSLRLQLALLDREFDDLDYDALRALDADISPHAPSMSEEEINTLPVFKYKFQAQQGSASARKSGDGPSVLLPSSSGSSNEKSQDAYGASKTPEDELTCSVCLEQVVVGDLLRSLPCLHQFHVECIDPWLRQQGTCPVCKHQVSDSWRSGGNGEIVDGSYMV
ncbi:E3 ubiquitin-protein ligase SDIR1 isoform X1 [Brachypodium distachyon]|uniref:E3 ubiquitin-protein ligase SDIR1 isoform X1 n=1 Tax=Brachypodium distachyon TaxID=15368 RepID=UPI00052FF5F1|nr:E3 ubiquitin-protein ligase SDIR1 isoform X1 [Brachypodium distachyon]|eukprot:XP_003558246.2 E3 ubiquitin-protein ligase SDIR1 isoform X1 [Brachypodium distachyon]